MLAIQVILCLGVVAAVAYWAYVRVRDGRIVEQVTSLYRGERSERKLVLRLVKMGVNPRAIFHDLYLQKPNGEYTQIDVAVATSAGLIVFEVKDYGGWIFGNEGQRYWTKVLAYGRFKSRFYNPIMQNHGHIKALRSSLPQNPGIPIYSVIVFYGNCIFRNLTYYSGDTYILHPREVNDVVADIMSRPNADFGNKYEIMDVLTQAARNGEDPLIVASQQQTAGRYARNSPQPVYRRRLFYGLPRLRFPFRW